MPNGKVRLMGEPKLLEAFAEFPNHVAAGGLTLILDVRMPSTASTRVSRSRPSQLRASTKSRTSLSDDKTNERLHKRSFVRSPARSNGRICQRNRTSTTGGKHFGTGYSSLAYLHTFPLDTLKIDRSFVSDGGEGLSNPEIIATILSLARNLRFQVVAEGIETDEQQNCCAAWAAKRGRFLFLTSHARHGPQS